MQIDMRKQSVLEVYLRPDTLASATVRAKGEESDVGRDEESRGQPIRARASGHDVESRQGIVYNRHSDVAPSSSSSLTIKT